MTQLFSLPKVVPLSSLGAILPGSKLHFFQTGTSNPQAVYQNIGLTVAHAQPVQADGAGVFAPIYLDSAASNYRVRLTDSNDVQQWQLDDIPSNQNQAQTFRLTSAAPTLIFDETDGGAGNRKSRIIVNATEIAWQLLDDAEAELTAVDILRIPRSGMSLGQVKIAGNAPIVGPYVLKESSQTRISTTTLANDSTLILPLASGQTYLVEGEVFFSATVTAGMGIKLALHYSESIFDSTLPIIISYVNGASAITRAPMINATPITFATLSTVAEIDCVKFSHVIRPNIEGNLSVQWAQNSSTAQNLTVWNQSWLRAQRIG